MKLDLTEQEAANILKFIDLGLKSQGIAAIGAANSIIQKIQAAQQSNETAAVADPAPSVAG